MEKKILFSPIGGKDPINHVNDGSMLHICRVYQPDVVYLYLSSEMCAFHRKDNRYGYCIEQLGKLLGHEFQVYYILREDLKEVQVFDTFVVEFQKILKEIEEKYPEGEIYLNVSSGTPAMKSALQTLNVLSNKMLHPIQVRSPFTGINPPDNDRKDYEVEISWELDEDNEPDYRNRCQESATDKLFVTVQKEIILRYIHVYDYVAAFTSAKLIEKDLNPDLLILLEAATYRMKLQLKQVDQLLKETGYSFSSVRRDRVREIYEYLLNLEIKLKKEEYADFLRAITPLVVDLFEITLKQIGNLDCDKYTRIKTKKTKIPNAKDLTVRVWDIDKIHENTRMREILDRAYYGEFRADMVSSDHLLRLIQEYLPQEHIDIMDKAETIRNIESQVRNYAAHEIVSVTASWIEKETNYTPQGIFKLLKDYTTDLNLGIKRADWKSYDDMNQLMIKTLKG